MAAELLLLLFFILYFVLLVQYKGGMENAI